MISVIAFVYVLIASLQNEQLDKLQKLYSPQKINLNNSNIDVEYVE